MTLTLNRLKSASLPWLLPSLRSMDPSHFRYGAWVLLMVLLLWYLRWCHLH